MTESNACFRSSLEMAEPTELNDLATVFGGCVSAIAGRSLKTLP